LWNFAAWHIFGKTNAKWGAAMVKREPVGVEGIPPDDCGLAKKYLGREISRHQIGRQQPQPDEGKGRRPPLAPEGSISQLSIAERLRQLAAKREEH
jgi:hypothetical protein